VIPYLPREEKYLGRKENKGDLLFPKIFSLAHNRGKVTKGGRNSLPYPE